LNCNKLFGNSIDYDITFDPWIIHLIRWTDRSKRRNRGRKIGSHQLVSKRTVIPKRSDLLRETLVIPRHVELFDHAVELLQAIDVYRL